MKIFIYLAVLLMPVNGQAEAICASHNEIIESLKGQDMKALGLANQAGTRYLLRVFVSDDDDWTIVATFEHQSCIVWHGEGWKWKKIPAGR